MATNNAENPKVDKGAPAPKPAAESGQSVYAKKRQDKGAAKKRNQRGKKEAPTEEFEQRTVDLARVTRVMAGGKRMRFRACVAIGDKRGRIGLGLAKGADVSLAMNKAVNNAKKAMVEVPIVNDTIPHDIMHKFGAAKVMLKPAKQGRGVIAGGALRIMLELAGIKNITSKNLGTNNKVTIAKCLMEALDLLKKVEPKKPKAVTEAKTPAETPESGKGEKK
jgi:small subunit ribosomal protein S5